MLTAERKAERLKKITGSDASIICSVSRYCTPYQLWRYKVGLDIEEDISDKPAVKAGIMLEDAVRNWFTDVTGKKVETDDEFLIHPEHEWMAANIDGRIVGENAIFEAKTSSSDIGWGEQGDNKIPDNYLCQVVHYCAVTQADRAYIAVLIRGVDFRTYVYERDLKLEKIIIDKEKKFYDMMIDKVTPDFTNKEDVLSYLSSRVSDEVMTTEPAIEADVEHLKFLNVQEKSIREQQKHLKDKICIYMGDKQTLVGTDGKICCTWKLSKQSEKFNAKKLKEEMPDIYSKFTETKDGSRRFLTK